MTPELRSRLVRAGRGGAVVLVVALAFGLGVLVSGGAEPMASPTRGAPAAAHSSMPGMAGMDMGAGAQLEARDRVTLTPHARALARLRTTVVRRLAQPGIEVHLLGRVDYDEMTLRSITTWIGGRVDRLHVDITGASVRRGQVIATLYSPEVYAAHQDMLSAAGLVRRLAAGSELARSAAEATLAASQQRLRLLGVPEGELAAMLRATAPWRQVPIRSPFAGTVVERAVTAGQYVQTGAVLFRIADLSRLWVQLDAYETDLPMLAVGQLARLRLEGQPGAWIDGRIAFIDPSIDPHRRTARVRIEVANADGRLRPAMFVEAVVSGRVSTVEATPLLVPETAPLFTGRRSIVYVELPNADRPTYQIREVRLGPRLGESYPVVAGLNDGDRVVTEGAFVLDADLQIRGGESMMLRADDRDVGPWDRALPAPDALRAGLAQVVRAYLDAQAALARDALPDAHAAATRMGAAIDAVRPRASHEPAVAWRAIADAMRPNAAHLAGALTLEDARGSFEALSTQLLALLRTFGNPLGDELRVVHCSMAENTQTGTWVQLGDVADNPYLGAQMRTCGDVRMRLEPRGYAPAAPAPTPARTPAGTPAPPMATPGAPMAMPMAADAGGHSH
jgi:Cu(I)/Ag(I) efflux system membrane fusion protein